MAACRCCRSEAVVPKPESAAIRSTGRSVVSSSRRARRPAGWTSHRFGLIPVSSRNRRVKVRTLITRVRPARLGSAGCPAGPAPRPGSGPWRSRRGSGRSMNWAWPPSRRGGTTRAPGAPWRPALIPAQHVQAQVEARRDTGRGEHVAVVDIEDVGSTSTSGYRADQLGVLPVGGRPPPVKQSGCGERTRRRRSRSSARWSRSAPGPAPVRWSRRRWPDG